MYRERELTGLAQVIIVCYAVTILIAAAMGIEKRIRLKEGAVPTIFERERMSGGSVPMASLDQNLVQVSSDPGPSTQ